MNVLTETCMDYADAIADGECVQLEHLQEAASMALSDHGINPDPDAVHQVAHSAMDYINRSNIEAAKY